MQITFKLSEAEIVDAIIDKLENEEMTNGISVELASQHVKIFNEGTAEEPHTVAVITVDQDITTRE